jgi:2-enoate reductase
LLADPEWPNKVRRNQEEDIKPCTGCHEGCLYRDQTEKTMSCAVNPAAGGELYFGLKPLKERKKVLVAGGGVAGMEAAIILSKRGHEVMLFEKTGELGGHLKEASVPDFKEDLLRLLNWYKKQLKKSDVKVKMNTEVTTELIEENDPDAVIIATGSINATCNIPGAEDSNIIYATDVLLGRKEAGQKVAVIGGGMLGLELALWLAKKGKEVTIIEKLPEVGVDGIMGSKEMIIDLLYSNNVKIITNKEVAGISDGEIELVDSLTKKKTSISSIEDVIISTGLVKNDGLYEEIYKKYPQLDVYKAGDCKEPRKILNAIWEGYHISRCL